MAQKTTTTESYNGKNKKKNPGVHSKKNSSINKNSKNYRKRNVGQG